MNSMLTLDWSTLLWGLGMGVIVLVLTLLLMPSLIQALHRLKFGQTEREEGLESHKKKTGTPTMGGIGFVFIPLVVYALFSLFSPFKWSFIATFLWAAYVGFGLIGLADDYLIIIRHTNDGLPPKVKLGLQILLGGLLSFVYMKTQVTTIYLPGPTLWIVPTILFFILGLLVYAGSTNAVNFSDGVDGLCAGLCAIAFAPFIAISIWENSLDGATIAFMIICALLGYLRFNYHPAKVFMGDTGSLALGGVFAAFGMVTHFELLLIILGLVFVVEALSVIIQVAVYKATHKRVFRMAPIHHHFEKKGWSEKKVCFVFWSWGALFALLSLALAWMSL